MIQASTNDVLPIKRQIELLTLPPQKRRRVMAKLGRVLQQRTRKNIRQQKDIYGKAFAKRSNKAKAEKRRRKLLRKMGRMLMQRSDDRKVTVTFKGKAAEIAHKHHHGHKTTMTKMRFKREMKRRGRGEEYYDNPATAEQAGALVKQLGYRRPIGKKRVRVSQRWIRQNMTIAQAGAIIKAIREAKGLAARSGESWTLEIPARPFFAGTEQWVKRVSLDILEQETIRQLAQ